MNNKGFTLIELIIVIALLAMITLLSTPNIIKLIEKNKVDDYNSTIDSIVEAAELYVSNNRYDSNKLVFDNICIPTDDNSKRINAIIILKNLIDAKVITTPVKNFCTDEELSNDTQIKIILNCGTRQFNYDIVENSTLKRRTGIGGINGLKITKCNDLY